MKSKPSLLNRLARRFNKLVTNPILMNWAGRGNYCAAVVHHAGRKSGREYATPVVAKPIPGGRFLIPLPCGTDTDWCRNVLAAGGARLDVEGESVQVTNLRVASLRAEVAARCGVRKRIRLRSARGPRCSIEGSTEGSAQRVVAAHGRRRADGAPAAKGDCLGSLPGAARPLQGERAL